MNRREFLIGRSIRAKQAEMMANETGASAVEYSLIGGIMAVALVASLPKVAKAERRNLKCIKRAMKGRTPSRFCRTRGA